MGDPRTRPLGAAGVLSRVGYGALFVVALPALLVAVAVRAGVPAAVPRTPTVGVPVAVVGALLLGLGVVGLVRRGGGLPMNAFPPPRLVTTGAFAVVGHPIYVGFCLGVAGVSLTVGSAGGLFVATPLAVVGALALVQGYERLDLARRFGTLAAPLLGVGRLAPAARALGLDRAWRRVLDAAERLANSWSARRIGPLRVINHAVFSGLAGGVGAAIAVLAAGTASAGLVTGLMIAGAVGAAVVGQLLVGSSGGLSRPFGYFGGLAAIAVVGAVAWLVRPDAGVVLAAFCLAAPWTQALGRLRCLVQGCCHGGPAPAASGIVVTNPHSRVCGQSPYCGLPIYPTQVYSIVGNLLLGPALLLAWQAGCTTTLIMGGYLVGAGAVRFVEEAYRGEPLTPVVGRLRLYQWFAVVMFVGGALLICAPGVPVPPLTWDAAPVALAVGLLFFAVCGAALSVDAPESRRRFTRLSG